MQNPADTAATGSAPDAAPRSGPLLVLSARDPGQCCSSVSRSACLGGGGPPEDYPPRPLSHGHGNLFEDVELTIEGIF